MVQWTGKITACIIANVSSPKSRFDILDGETTESCDRDATLNVPSSIPSRHEPTCGLLFELSQDESQCNLGPATPTVNINKDVHTW